VTEKSPLTPDQKILVDRMRALADARDDYDDPNVRCGTDAVRLVADILEGKNEGWGWLPSWRWSEFGVPEPSDDDDH
jgi:hypothetical protein